MGWHECEYLTETEAKALKLKHVDVIRSSGDVTLSYSSGRSWRMPDMALLYVELGWVPPKEFVDDVMRSGIVKCNREQTRSVDSNVVSIGYLKPEKDPLPKPFKISGNLPEGFLENLEKQMKFKKAMTLGSQVIPPGGNLRGGGGGIRRGF